MKLLHASRRNDLHLIGMRPNQPPVASRRPMPHLYFGTDAYIENQYFKYCPKGDYYFYEVDLDGIDLDDSCVGEQWRTTQSITPDRIKLTGKVVRV